MDWPSIIGLELPLADLGYPDDASGGIYLLDGFPEIFPKSIGSVGGDPDSGVGASLIYFFSYESLLLRYLLLSLDLADLLFKAFADELELFLWDDGTLSGPPVNTFLYYLKEIIKVVTLS